MGACASSPFLKTTIAKGGGNTHVFESFRQGEDEDV